MKKWIVIALALALILSCAACSAGQEDFDAPVQFYYLPEQMSFGPDGNTFACEIRDAKDYEDLESLLNLYLCGPADENVRHPFPEGTKIVSLTKNDEVTEIVLSDSFASLSGIDLTLACACLSQTVFGISDAQAVSISAETRQLDRSTAIIIRNSDFSVEN